MISLELLNKVDLSFSIVSSREEHGVLIVEILSDKLIPVLKYFRDNLMFDFMNFMTAVDWPEEKKIEAVYRLFSRADKNSVIIKVKLDRDKPEIDSVSEIFRTAEWHERETAEMFGIVFKNHPDPRLLLLPDDFSGHPLRKDFTHPNLIPIPEGR